MAHRVRYTGLSPAEAAAAIRATVQEAEQKFGALATGQLNWKPDAGRWSAAQCFDHLLTANQLMLRSMQDAVRNPSRTFWQRIPVLPGVWGALLIRSQSPETNRKFTAPKNAQPSTSEISADIVHRFAEQQLAAATWMGSLLERDAAATIMVSPFLRHVTYSLLDGCRLMAAHDRRHFEQAVRVTKSQGFPTA